MINTPLNRAQIEPRRHVVGILD